MAAMESITVEFPRDQEPDWLGEMADEFTEDPYCHLVMIGADDDGVVLTTMWSAEVAAEVAVALEGMEPRGVVRRMPLSVPTTDEVGL